MGPLEEVGLGGGEEPVLRPGARPTGGLGPRSPCSGPCLPLLLLLLFRLVLSPHLSQAHLHALEEQEQSHAPALAPRQGLEGPHAMQSPGLKGLQCCTRQDSNCFATFSKTKRESRWLSIWHGTGTTESRAILANQGSLGACALSSGRARSPPDGLKGRDPGFLFSTQDDSQVLLGTKYPLKGQYETKPHRRLNSPCPQGPEVSTPKGCQVPESGGSAGLGEGLGHSSQPQPCCHVLPLCKVR